MSADKVYGNCRGPASEYISLISPDGHEFVIKRDIALVSNTINAMLTGPGQFDEHEKNEVNFRDMPSHILRKVCHYLKYKHHYQDASIQIPEFPVEGDEAVDLLMAANFLDC